MGNSPLACWTAVYTNNEAQILCLYAVGRREKYTMSAQLYFQQLTVQVRNLLGCEAVLLVLDSPEAALRHPLLERFQAANFDHCYGSPHLQALLDHECVRAVCDSACQRGQMQSLNHCRIAIDEQHLAQSLAIAPVEGPGGILAFLLLVNAPAGAFSQGEYHLLHHYLQTIALDFEKAVRILCPALNAYPGTTSETGNQDHASSLVPHSLEYKQTLDGLKNEFVSIVSHELRAPLTAIKGYASLLQVYGVSDQIQENNRTVEMTPARQQRYLNTIVEQARHLEVLIGDLLDVSRIQAGKLALRFTSVHVGPLCQQAARLAQQRIDEQQLEGHHLRCELSPDLPPIWADPHRLQQILNNLLDNAMKYSPAGGLIEIYARPVHLAPRSLIQIVVRDQGIGIAEQHRARLFLPFSRLDHPITSQVQGAGLGLYITRQLVEAMDGEIELTSREDEGTTVTIHLPVLLPGEKELLSEHSIDFSLRKS